MPKRRMLVVCQHFWPESFRLNDICDYFVEQGYEVDVLCGIPNYPKGKFFEGYSYLRNRKQRHNGINVRRVFEIPRGNASTLGIFLNNISFSFACLFHIPRLLTRKYDRIFMYQLSPVMMAVPGIIVGKLRKIDTTMWVIDPWPESLFSFLPVHNAFLRRLATTVSHWHYKHVNKIVVLSEPIRKNLLATTGFSEDKIIVLPMACEKVYEEEIYDKQLAKRFNTGFNILFAGTITPILSFETVVSTAVLLKKRGFVDINWVIIGDGMSRSWLEEEVANKQLAQNFFFEGLKQPADIPSYTTTVADVLYSGLVKSNFLEATIPAKINSYLAAGKPILLSMNGAAPELIRKIGCGLAGPAEDTKALANNIEKLYKMSPAQRKTMGDKARTYHFKHFERNLVMRELLDFIESE